MPYLSSITGSASAVWGALQAIIKAGMSSGALQLIAGALVSLSKGDAKEHSLKRNCALAVAEVVEYEPETDNVEALTNAIARLSYVLEEELKRKKERQDATSKA